MITPLPAPFGIELNLVEKQVVNAAAERNWHVQNVHLCISRPGWVEEVRAMDQYVPDGFEL